MIKSRFRKKFRRRHFEGADGKIAQHFYKDTDTGLGVIRFNSEYVKTELTIPYGEGFGGIKTDGLPFTGNGFAGGADIDYITPEYSNSTLKM